MTVKDGTKINAKARRRGQGQRCAGGETARTTPATGGLTCESKNKMAPPSSANVADGGAGGSCKLRRSYGRQQRLKVARGGAYTVC